jgi:hypothetical protein
MTPTQRAKADAKRALREWEECQRIDDALAKEKRGEMIYNVLFFGQLLWLAFGCYNLLTGNF